MLHTEHCIEKQHTLLRPMGKIAGYMPHIKGLTQVLLNLGVNIAQGRRQRLVLWHRKTQSHGLIRTVIRILADDHHPHSFYRHQIHGSKHLSPRGIHALARSLFCQQKLAQLFHVGLIELIAHQASPRRL